LAGGGLAAAAVVNFCPAVIFRALYRRWDWKMPAAVAGTTVIAYVPFLGGGRAVFGFLPGYLSEEGLHDGSGFFLWNLLKGATPLIGHLSVVTYLALAAALMASLSLHVVLKDDAAPFISAATSLAVAAMVLVSPHYPWYFAWLVPFLCFTPYPSVLYLTVASLLLYFVPGGRDPQGARMAFEAAIYAPFALLVGCEVWRHRAARADVNWTKLEELRQHTK